MLARRKGSVFLKNSKALFEFVFFTQRFYQPGAFEFKKTLTLCKRSITGNRNFYRVESFNGNTNIPGFRAFNNYSRTDSRDFNTFFCIHSNASSNRSARLSVVILHILRLPFSDRQKYYMQPDVAH